MVFPTSLKDLGYTDVGLDDFWQTCGRRVCCGSRGGRGKARFSLYQLRYMFTHNNTVDEIRLKAAL
jgi:hypothetical protein